MYAFILFTHLFIYLSFKSALHLFIYLFKLDATVLFQISILFVYLFIYSCMYLFICFI